MATLTDAFQLPDVQHFEKKENPQAYDQRREYVQHVKAARHVLGLVGGNEVSIIKGSMVDLESDLQGITRPNTDCPGREHKPPVAGAMQIERNNTKSALVIDTTPLKLPVYQMWAYPAVIGPEPLVKESCARPEKY